MSTTMCAGHIKILLSRSVSWPSLKVSPPLIQFLLHLNSQTADRKYDKNVAFRTFKHQLYHSSIAAILQPLRDGMTKPVIRRCPDGHFRRVIYDLAAFISDYPEQVLLAGTVQHWCPKCVIFALFNSTTANIEIKLQMYSFSDQSG